MHAIEKILAAKAGKSSVHAGEIVNCRVDWAGINDLYYQTVKSFSEMGGERVVDPEHIVLFFDHYAPCATEKQADNHKRFRAFAREQGIHHLMDINEGVCHQVMADHGFSAPGEVIVITDSHTTTHGAFGAFGTGVGATDLAVILVTGRLWFKVPEVIRINLTGKIPAGVYAKDIVLSIIGKLKADYAVYKAVEFAGPALQQLSISERMALCNMTTEMGAKTSYIQPDAISLQFLKERGCQDFTVYETDADYVYAADLTFDVSEVEPQLAAPFSVDNVQALSAYAGMHVDQAYFRILHGRAHRRFRRGGEDPRWPAHPRGDAHGDGAGFKGCARGVPGEGLHPDLAGRWRDADGIGLRRLPRHPSGPAGR